MWNREQNNNYGCSACANGDVRSDCDKMGRTRLLTTGQWVSTTIDVMGQLININTEWSTVALKQLGARAPHWSCVLRFGVCWHTAGPSLSIGMACAEKVRVETAPEFVGEHCNTGAVVRHFACTGTTTDQWQLETSLPLSHYAKCV